MLTNAPRGTKDILPDTVGQWTYVEEKIRNRCVPACKNILDQEKLDAIRQEDLHAK